MADLIEPTKKDLVLTYVCLIIFFIPLMIGYLIYQFTKHKSGK